MTSFNDMLTVFGVSDQLLTRSDREALDQRGFLVLPPDPTFWQERGIDFVELRALVDELVEREGWRGGIEGKEQSVRPDKPLDPGSDRLANLLEKDRRFRAFISHPKVLAAVHYVIKAPFKCSAVDMRSPRKYGGEQQIHIDWLPRTREDQPFDCVFVGFYLDGMTISNGAARFMPGTHRRLDWPNEYIDVLSRHPDEVRVEVPVGGIIVSNGLVWHAGARNDSGVPRRSIYVDYRNRAVGQLLNQKRYLSARTIESLSEAERYLLAVRPEDPTDETVSLGPGDAYRARYGNHYLPMAKVMGSKD